MAMNICDVSKLTRMPLLSLAEQELLVSLIDEKVDVADIRALKKREVAWKDIQQKFCAMPGSISRTVQQLKKCWQNVKNKTK